MTIAVHPVDATMAAARAASFTKRSIKFGISLWLGVIKENSKLESRILAEIASNWESTVRKKRGIFSRSFR